MLEVFTSFAVKHDSETVMVIVSHIWESLALGELEGWCAAEYQQQMVFVIKWRSGGKLVA